MRKYYGATIFGISLYFMLIYFCLLRAVAREAAEQTAVLMRLWSQTTQQLSHYGHCPWSHLHHVAEYSRPISIWDQDQDQTTVTQLCTIHQYALATFFLFIYVFNTSSPYCKE